MKALGSSLPFPFGGVLFVFHALQNVSWSESVSRWQALSNLARIIRRDVFVTDLHIPEVV